MQTTSQPLAEQELAEVGADEAGAAGHEHPHGAAPQTGKTGLRPIE